MQLQTKIKIRKQIKHWFIRLKLHRLFAAGFWEELIYLAKLSQWCEAHVNLKFDDRNISSAPRNRRFALYQFLLEQEALQGEIDYLEFGVAAGESLRWWVENNHHPASRFIGFDSFGGLPENFGPMQKGYFSTATKPPQIDDARCRFVVGLFQDTVYEFLKTFTFERKTVVHLDADLYSSTLFVLAALAPKFKKDDIIIFDEFGVPMHEFRAFSNFISAFPMRYEVLGQTNNYLQVAITLI
jgi:hypothetical protein